MGGVTADTSNHITGFSYDTSGNTLADGNYNYTWDGESQMKTAAGVTYTYDGDGRRVKKSSGTLYWYGSGGEILSETDSAGTVTAEYVFFGGKRVAIVPAGSTAQLYVEDFLGSSRVVTTNTGAVCYDADFTPFGAERTYTNTCTQNAYKFEGKERDSETQNDNFGARYYTWRFGRWLSSDWSTVPVAVPYANLTNPQTLNLYSMVADDPESFADLDGHVPSEPQDEFDVAEAVYAQRVSADQQASSEKKQKAQQQSSTNQQSAQNRPNNRSGYDTQDQAAAGALRNSNGASIKRNKEEAGLIYKKDGKYHFTGPVEGTDQGANPHKAKAPRGSRVVGDYHTHGDYSIAGPNGEAIRTHDPHRDDFNSNHFSGPDKMGIAHDAIGKPEYRGYLGTPSGRFLTYNPATGQEGELQ